ncbi:hypothetical protein BZG36_05060, partial [Bifiguratus adelaidae]
ALVERLVVLQYADQYTFVGNVTLLEQACLDLSSKPPDRIYVDVDEGPQKMLMPPLLQTYLTNDLLSGLRSARLTSAPSLLNFPQMPRFMVSLSGWLLGYPVVYVTGEAKDKGESISESDNPSIVNTLNNIPLTLFRVTASYDASRFSKRPLHDPSVAPFRKPSVELMSFSCPTALLSHDEKTQVCQTLASAIRLAIAAQADLFDAHVAESQVVLPHVAL